MPLVRVSASVTAELYTWVRTEANLHHVSVSKLVHDLVAAQRDLRRQLAGEGTAATGDGAGGHPGGLVLLERMKEDIGRSIDRQAAQLAAVRQQVGQALVMLDRAFLAYLQHTPTVPPAEHPRAVAEAQRRYEKWIADVRAHLPVQTQETRHGSPLAPSAAPGAPARKAQT